jgi:hypothetical protein
MDHHDQELLDKQLSHIQPVRQSEATTILVILVVFLAGLMFGDFLSAPNQPRQQQLASNDGVTSLFQGAPPLRR